MKLITIIPAYNEEKAIKDVIYGAVKYSDVLVVDDGSTDHTFKLAKKTGSEVIKHEKNRGKGAAIKTGLKYSLNSGYDVIILMDGDGQHNPLYIPSFISSIKNAELVLGSRFIAGTPEDMPFQRRLSNKITTKIIKYVTGYEITDSQSGFRAIKSQVARIFLDIDYDDYVYESEMLYKAYKNKIRVVEVAIPCDYHEEKSHITKKHVVNYIFFVINLLMRKLKGRIKY